MATASEKKSNRRHVLIGNKGWGLYYGDIETTDEEVGRDGFVTVYNCRHVAYWKGGTGGVTSLASLGPREGSRIGAPCEQTLIRDVATIFTVSPDAAARFDAMKAEIPR